MLIPNTVAFLKNSPHPEQAKRLIDFLLSPAVEKMLMQSAAEQIPLRAEIPASEKIRSFGKLHFTDLDFAQAAKIIGGRFGKLLSFIRPIKLKET